MIDIKRDIPLAPYTTFRIGGPAKFFVEAVSEDGLKEAFGYAEDNGLRVFLLGGGSNLLVSDDGFDGLVIRMKMAGLDADIGNGTIAAGAGVPIAKLVKYSVESGLSGLEWAAGLPGNLGGAIRGNAGTFGRSMKDVVRSVAAYDFADKRIREFGKEDCGFAYRGSIFKKDSNLVIVSAVLELEKGDRETMREKVAENINWRKSAFPEGFSAGSFFKHTEATENNLKKLRQIPRFSELKMHEKDTIPSGFVIEECGLKGKKIGGAMVSEKHANFILNTGTATAEDVVMLASFIKQQVRDEFGIQLQEEIQYVGFQG